MKRFILFILAVLCAASCLVLSGCSATKQCESDEFIEALADADEVSACIYADGEGMLSLKVTDELCELTDGDWQKISGKTGAKKVLSVTVSMQYEVCFFDDGSAMIYYGYCGVFQKDRQYYKITLDNGLDYLVEYVRENGTEIEDEETTAST